MNLGLENKRKTIIASVLGGIGLIFFIWQVSGLFSSTPAPNAPPPPVIKTTSTTDTHAPAAGPIPAAPVPAGKAAASVAYTAAQLDPTLHMEGMLEAESLVYAGSGRNIFSMQSAPPPVPKPVAPARPSKPAPPVAPAPYVPPPPPPPPPIELKFFGTDAAKNGTTRAFLLHGEDVFVAAPGEIIDRRYKVVSISPSGVRITDLPNDNTQTIPLSQ